MNFALAFFIVGQDENRGLQIEFQKINRDGRIQVINDIEVNAESGDTFRVVCKLNTTEDLLKFNTIKVLLRKLENDTLQTLAQMQNVDNTAPDTYRIPVLGEGVSGWQAVGEYDTNTTNGRNSYVGVDRPVSVISCNDSATYACEIVYIDPGFNVKNKIIHKQLSIQGNTFIH